jgi:hypothetical protein
MRKEYDPCFGGRISKELLERIQAKGLTNTHFLRKALTFYLDYLDSKTRVVVNKQSFDSKYETLCSIMDKHLDRDTGVSSKEVKE